MAGPSARRLASLAGGLAAFLWASYYILLVLLPRVPYTEIIVVPFLVAGAAFLLWHPGRTPGQGRALLLRQIASWQGLALGGMFLVLQVDVVFATRLAGAVDASLVTLLADVVATPLLVFALYRQDGDRLRSWPFWLGVLIAAAGATGTIVGAGSSEPLTRMGVLALLPLPFLVAVFFVWLDRVSRRIPTGDVLGAAALVAAAVGALGGSLLFGWAWVATPLGPLDAFTLVVMGLTSFYLAPWAYFWAAQKTTIVIPAVLQALIPVFTLVLVAALAPILGTTVPWVAWLGIPLAFFGSALAVMEPKKPQGPANGPAS